MADRPVIQLVVWYDGRGRPTSDPDAVQRWTSLDVRAEDGQPVIGTYRGGVLRPGSDRAKELPGLRPVGANRSVWVVPRDGGPAPPTDWVQRRRRIYWLEAQEAWKAYRASEARPEG
jgi:hypothetical protein